MTTADVLTPAATEKAAKGALLAGYKPSVGVHDEMMSADGQVRPHYRQMIAALARMDEAERGRRFATASQYLREAGVFYRVYGGVDQGDRPRSWPLAHPPLIIGREEWSALEAGLIQRADFLEKLLGDLYGERTLLRDGVLPPAILGRNPEFLRPVADQGKNGQPLIRFIAVDLGRGPDGRWWVLSDRTQAASGAGFALENRVATSRAFPDLIRDLKIQRLASFFRDFRETLYSLDDGKGVRAGLLSPGPHNETYFEHAYLARYLGLLLLEGGDLAVHGSSVEVRTVDGAKPIRVLWRRLDSDFADPLELYARSRIGTPGLARAVRDGGVELVNALGSGILETRALLAFQPALAKALIGEELKLPTVATWWCGQEKERAFVAKNRDRLSLAPAFPLAAGVDSRRRPLDLGIRPASASADLADELATNGLDVVAQEIVALSTAPVFADGKLVARPVTMRVFLARGVDGWSVMPGAFARTSSSTDPSAVSMQSGGHSVDVWVPGAGPSADREVSLLEKPKGGFSRRLPSAPPARAADNLYWLGRYVERAEAATRLVRLHAARLAEGERNGALEQAIGDVLTTVGVDAAVGDPSEGLLELAGQAFATASRIRDRFSPDGWRVLGEIVDLIETFRATPAEDLVTLSSGVLTRLSGFAGLVHESMYQHTAWRFLQCGRLIERGRVTAGVAAALGDTALEGGLEALLEFTDSRVTYRRRYSVNLSRETALDLAVLDPLNPRAVAFQVNGLKAMVDSLPGRRHGESLDMLSRRAVRLQSRLATGHPSEIDDAFLLRIAEDFGELSNLLSKRYFGAGPLPAERLEGE